MAVMMDCKDDEYDYFYYDEETDTYGQFIDFRDGKMISISPASRIEKMKALNAIVNPEEELKFRKMKHYVRLKSNKPLRETVEELKSNNSQALPYQK